jgi:hypothetical protein
MRIIKMRIVETAALHDGRAKNTNDGSKGEEEINPRDY